MMKDVSSVSSMNSMSFNRGVAVVIRTKRSRYAQDGDGGEKTRRKHSSGTPQSQPTRVGRLGPAPSGVHGLAVSMFRSRSLVRNVHDRLLNTSQRRGGVHGAQGPHKTTS